MSCPRRHCAHSRNSIADYKRITSYLREVATLDDPRSRGKALTGPLAGLWRYRVGDYRITCDIHDNQLTIYAIDIDHRSTVYRN